MYAKKTIIGFYFLFSCFTYMELQNKITAIVGKLSIEEQRQLLNYIKTMKATPVKKKKVNPFAVFGGTISNADLDLMEKAIEEGCENIDKSEW